MEEPETEISYETVAGIVNARLHVKDSVRAEAGLFC